MNFDASNLAVCTNSDASIISMVRQLPGGPHSFLALRYRDSKEEKLAGVAFFIRRFSKKTILHVIKIFQKLSWFYWAPKYRAAGAVSTGYGQSHLGAKSARLLFPCILVHQRNNQQPLFQNEPTEVDFTAADTMRLTLTIPKSIKRGLAASERRFGIFCAKGQYHFRAADHNEQTEIMLAIQDFVITT